MPYRRTLPYTSYRRVPWSGVPLYYSKIIPKWLVEKSLINLECLIVWSAYLSSPILLRFQASPRADFPTHSLMASYGILWHLMAHSLMLHSFINRAARTYFIILRRLSTKRRKEHLQGLKGCVRDGRARELT